MGVGDYDTYSEGASFKSPKQVDEFRIWPMLRDTQKYGRLEFENRVRTEFRFSGSEYRHRYRYRLGIQYQLSEQQQVFKKIKLAMSNELFWGDFTPFFQRNRLLTTLNYKHSEALEVIVGYMYQFDYTPTVDFAKDFLYVGLSFSLFDQR